jgi:hypothetical protein
MAIQPGTAVVTDAPATKSAAPVAPVVLVATKPPGPDYTALGSRARTGPVGGGQLVRRVIILVFGLIQIVIALRFVLLLLDARTANVVVSAILNVSQVFVAPFNGMLSTDALVSNGSVVDVAAIVAFIGWSILELIILWAVGIFRRQPA